MKTTVTSTYLSILLINLFVIGFAFPVFVEAAVKNHDDGGPSYNAACTNQNTAIEPDCQCALSSLCSHHGLSGIGLPVSVGETSWSPFMHSVIFSTGGRSMSGVGELQVTPSAVFRSHSFFTQDPNDATNLHFSADARLSRYDDPPTYYYLHYRDDWGNIMWFGRHGWDSALGCYVYRSIGGGLREGSRPGAVVAIKELGTQGANGYEMLQADGRRRKFNSGGWLIEDYDAQGNKITYVRDSQNFVTQIQLPTESGVTRNIQVNYTVYRTSGGYDHKRLTSIQYPNGVTYYYYYSSTTPPFYLNRLTVKDASGNILEDWTFNFESLSGKTINGVYNGNINTNTDFRLLEVKDRNGEVIRKYGYDDNFYDYIGDPNANFNYANEVKKVGDKDGWLLESPVYDDLSALNESPWEGVAINSNGSTSIHRAPTSSLQTGDVYISSATDWNTEQTLYLYNPVTDSYSVTHNVVKNLKRDIYGFQSNLVSSDYTYARYGSTTSTYQVDYAYNQGEPSYDDTTTKGFLNGGNLVWSKYYHHSGNLEVTYEYDLSQYFSPLKKVILDAAGLNIIHEFPTFNANGQPLSYKDPLGYTSNYTYTTKGQLNTWQSPMGRTVTLNYNSYGDLWKIYDPANRVTEMSYDANTSDLLWVKTPMGYYTRFEYDKLGRLIRVRDHDNNQVMQITYNDTTHTVTVTDGEGATTTYAYSTSLKRLTRTDNLDGTQFTTTYNYNNNKTINNISYPGGTATTFTYDALLRPRQAVTQNGSTSSTLLVKRDSLGQPREVQATREDGAQETTLYYYNADISLDRVQQPDGKVLDLGYDKLLRVTSLVRPTGSSQTMTQTYGYDQASQLTSTALGTYATATYGYNKDGQLRMIKRNNKTVTIYAYATDGRLSSIEHKQDPSNNTTYSTSTDAFSNTADDLNLTVLTYTYNNDSEITSRSRQIYSPPGTLSRTVTMGAGYDALGRMTSETYNGGGQYSVSRSYTYDKANNRTSKTEGGVTSTYNVYPGNRLQYVSRPGSSTQRFTYDSLGQLTAAWTDTDGDGMMDTNENRTEYYWTYTGLLKQAKVYTNSGATLTTLNYKYDESGSGLLREREVVGGTRIRFHWEGLNLYLEEEWSGSAWVPKRTYINQPSALGGALARFDLGTSNTLDTSDSGWFYHYDEAGNVILITDKNGGLIKHFEQDAWGNDLNGTFATTQNIRQHQTGKYLDEATGLYFFGARWYDPNIGRFISVSPLSPLGEEEYVYCSENPVNIADVDGVWGIQIGEWNFGLGDPTFLFDRYSWKDFRKSLASTIDGIIPLFDPFEKYYSDECGNIEPAYKLSRHIAGFSRDIGSAAFIPNLSIWIKHPILYEIGAKTVSAEIYALIAHLSDPVQKGEWLLKYHYNKSVYDALTDLPAWNQFGKTIGTGGTPGARLFLLGVFSALDYWTRR